MLSRTSRVSRLVVAAGLASFLLVVGASASAQQPGFQQFPPSDAWTQDPQLVKKLQAEVQRILRNTSSLDEVSKARLDQWYRNYFFRVFTTEEYWSKLPELRAQLVDRDLRGAKNKPALDHVMALTLNFMKQFSQMATLHPAVRYNAMLVIGDLNAVERGAIGPDGRKAMAPDPLPAAFPILFAEYKNPKQIDPVRLAALIGLLRHAKLDLARTSNRIPPQQRTAIVNEMLALVQSAPPEGRTPEGHAWMQRRGIEILAALEAVGQVPEVGSVLEGIVANKEAPMSLRCTAAEALGHWAPAGRVQVDGTALSHELGALAGLICLQGLTSIEEVKKNEELKEHIRTLLAAPNQGFTMPGMMYGSGMEAMGGSGYGEYEEAMDMSYGEDMEAMYGMYGGEYGYPGVGPAKPADPRVDRLRRRLKSQLLCIKAGLDGLALVQQVDQAPAQKAEVTKVKEGVDACLAATDPPEDKADLDGFAEVIKESLAKLAFVMPEDVTADAKEAIEAALGVGPEPPSDPTSADPSSTGPAAPANAGPTPPDPGPAPPGFPPDPAPGA